MYFSWHASKVAKNQSQFSVNLHYFGLHDELAKPAPARGGGMRNVDTSVSALTPGASIDYVIFPPEIM